MKKIYKKIILALLIFSAGFGSSFLLPIRKNIVLEEPGQRVIKNYDTISMMLETEANSGNYEMTTRSEWPTEGYVFNSELSKCEHGSELSWDDTNKRVVMSGNVSDKCYVYFDKVLTLATYVKSQYTGIQGENGIYYHDSTLTNGAGDNSYRYAGADPNNYVCFGSDAEECPNNNLYRIIGVFGDKVKLIKSDYATSSLLGTDGDYYGTGTPKTSYYKGSLTTLSNYSWNIFGNSNTWSESSLNKINLNTNFINNIGIEWAQKIATTTWKVGGNTYSNIYSKTPSVAYQNEIVNPDPTYTTDGAKEYTAQIGLMYVSDYGFAASPSYWTYPTFNGDYNDGSSDYRAAITSNWMHMGYNEWTISRNASNLNEAFGVDYTGIVYDGNASSPNGARPSFNLLPSITYKSGSGTQSDPIVIN